ncbi:benzoate diol dehydrogenase BenD [Azospirillum rugosum]|uniref:Dihydroxycyclohexadiene carboxylate dehydrogenase n=1 Tax=Azospirillum rugosum TaxID=416170 RepID=A0ABS4SX58_9PROT|nr:benzoate diol dehydrogenase BenD [Azospirillum rugosum]MBP2297140.1 dihydroxycyclohexadiene carboxylate dehydrogenase [Azospirillum rugosum]MDQ0530954.1 dihydroxycyclohexadiene carboxylate dehydrogenase [Azospirillum rugosum]
MNRFLNKIFVVTGAAQGVGRRVAERAASEGATVLLVDRSEHVSSVADAIRSIGGDATHFRADLETWDGAEQTMAEALKRYGRIDVLVNNVGGTIWAKPYVYYEPDQIEAEIRRSLFPTLWCCRAAAPSMIERKSGVIVNVSSCATRATKRVPYGAAKGGVNAITTCLALEVAEQGVRVVAIAPGGISAPERMIPRNNSKRTEQEEIWLQEIYKEAAEMSMMKRLGTLDEQAGAILFLASDDASYITGVTLPVAGGHPY